MTQIELDDIIFDIQMTILNLATKRKPTKIDIDNVAQLREIVNQLDRMVADGRITLKDA